MKTDTHSYPGVYITVVYGDGESPHVTIAFSGRGELPAGGDDWQIDATYEEGVPRIDVDAPNGSRIYNGARIVVDAEGLPYTPEEIADFEAALATEERREDDFPF